MNQLILGECLEEMRKMDRLVYDVYELTRGEIKVVEGKVKVGSGCWVPGFEFKYYKNE